MIEGLFETHINVANLERPAEFYESVLGMGLVYEVDSRVHFYWIGERGKAMLVLWENEPSQKLDSGGVLGGREEIQNHQWVPIHSDTREGFTQMRTP